MESGEDIFAFLKRLCSQYGLIVDNMEWFSTFAKASADRGKGGWGSAVAAGYGGTSWGSGKEPIQQKVFPFSPSPPINLYREQNV